MGGPHISTKFGRKDSKEEEKYERIDGGSA